MLLGTALKAVKNKRENLMKQKPARMLQRGKKETTEDQREAYAVRLAVVAPHMHPISLWQNIISESLPLHDYKVEEFITLQKFRRTCHKRLSTCKTV